MVVVVVVVVTGIGSDLCNKKNWVGRLNKLGLSISLQQQRQNIPNPKTDKWKGMEGKQSQTTKAISIDS